MTIETKALVISEELKRKVDMIYRFACIKCEVINGSVISHKVEKKDERNIYPLKIIQSKFI